MKTHGFKKFTAMLSAIAMTASCFAAFAVPVGAEPEGSGNTITVSASLVATVRAQDESWTNIHGSTNAKVDTRENTTKVEIVHGTNYIGGYYAFEKQEIPEGASLISATLTIKKKNDVNFHSAAFDVYPADYVAETDYQSQTVFEKIAPAITKTPVSANDAGTDADPVVADVTSIFDANSNNAFFVWVAQNKSYNLSPAATLTITYGYKTALPNGAVKWERGTTNNKNNEKYTVEKKNSASDVNVSNLHNDSVADGVVPGNGHLVIIDLGKELPVTALKIKSGTGGTMLYALLKENGLTESSLESSNWFRANNANTQMLIDTNYDKPVTQTITNGDGTPDTYYDITFKTTETGTPQDYRYVVVDGMGGTDNCYELEVYSTEDTRITVTAQNGEAPKAYYDDLYTAVTNAAANDTITIKKNSEVSNRLTNGDITANNITIDGGGYEAYLSSVAASKTLLFEVGTDKTLNLNNIKISGGSNYTINMQQQTSTLNMTKVTAPEGKEYSVRLGSKPLGSLAIDSETVIPKIMLNGYSSTDDFTEAVILAKPLSEAVLQTSQIESVVGSDNKDMLADGTNELAVVDGNIVIQKKTVAKTPLTVQTLPTGKADLTYNGEDQDLLEDGGEASTGGKMQYSTDYQSPEAQGTWSDTPPKGRDAKTYTVYYKAVPTEEGAATHTDSDVGSVDVTIKKATPEFPSDIETVEGGVYHDDMKLSDVTAPNVEGGKITWKDGATTLHAGDNEVQAEFTSDDMTNYEGTAEGTVTVNVKKATITDSEVQIEGAGTFEHDSSEHSITATTTKEGDQIKYADGSVTAESDTGSVSWLDSCPTYSNVGVHQVTVKVTRNENYEVYYKTVTITISEDKVIDPSKVTITPASDLTYQKDVAQELITSVSVSDLSEYNVTYKVVKDGEDGTAAEFKDTATATDAGTYKVTVKITKTGYADYESTPQTVTIAKAPSTFPSGLPTVEVELTDGMTLEDVTPPTTTGGTIAWKETSTAVTEGTAQYEAVFTPADSSNYNTAEGEVTVNAVKKTAPTPTPVEESPSTLTADVVAQLRAMDDEWTSQHTSSNKFITEDDADANKIETTARNHFGAFYSFGAVSLPEGATVTKATLSVYQGDSKFSGKPFVVKKTDNPADISKIEDVFNAAANAKNSGAEIGTTTMYEPDDKTYRTETLDVTNYFTEGERNSYLLYNADATDNNRQLSRKAELVIEFTTSGSEDKYVAEVIPADGGVGNKYETFKDAIAAVQEGETIKLLDDVTIDRMIFGGTAYSSGHTDQCNIDNVTIDGDSHTITSDGTKDMLFEADNKTLTFKNVTLEGGNKYTINAKNKAEIHLQGVTITPASGKVGLNMSTQTTLYADSATTINGLNYNNAAAPDGGTVIVNKEGDTNLTIEVAGAFTYGVPEEYTSGTLEVDGNGNLAVPAPAQPLTVETVPTAITDLVYDGSEQALVNEGAASAGGKIVYSLTGSGDWQDTVPTGTDAETYTVYYKAVAADSAQADKYIESAVGQVEVTIAKADIPSTAYTITGDGTFKVGSGSHTLEVTAAGFTVEYAEGDYSAAEPEEWLETCPSYGDDDLGEHKITVKLSNKNYNDLKVVRTITITDKEPITEVTVTAAEDLVYTGAAQELVSVTGENLGEYTITYYLDDVQQDGVPTGTNAGEYKVKVTVERDGYSTITLEKTVTIAKADITDITVTGYTGNVDGEAHGVTIEGDTTGYTVQYKTGDGEYSETAPTFKEAGVYTVTVKISRDNYNDLELTATVTLNEVTEPTPEPDYGFDEDYTPEEAPSGPTVYDEGTALEGWFSNNTDTEVTEHVVETKGGKLVMENNKEDEAVPSLWVGTQYAEVEDAAAADRITITFEYTPGSTDSRIYFVSADSDEISNGVDGSTEGIYRTAGGANGLGMTPGKTYDITLDIDNSTHTGQFTVIPKNGVGISLMSVLEPTDLPDGTNAVVFRPAAGATDTIDNFSAELMSTSIAINSVTEAQDGGYKASITATAADGAAVIAAVYRGGACMQVKFVSGDDVTFENAQSGDVIKAFLWESVETMKPLATPAQETIE